MKINIKDVGAPLKEYTEKKTRKKPVLGPIILKLIRCSQFRKKNFCLLFVYFGADFRFRDWEMKGKLK